MTPRTALLLALARQMLVLLAADRSARRELGELIRAVEREVTAEEEPNRG